MKAITIANWGAPVTFTADHPSPPAPSSEQVTLKVLAAGLHQLVRGQVTGTHYTTKTATLPYVPGADGVGITPDGRTLYFNSIQTGGAFAESITVPKAVTTPIPSGADPVQVAGLLNPGMSSWMALKTRTEGLRSGFTVVIVGVTAISGKVAVHFARSLGAARVIGIARNQKELAAIDLDERIVLKDNPAETDYSSLGDVDVILDYLYGPNILALLQALKSSVPTQFVQIGTLASQDIALPGAILREKNITLRGSGPGAWSFPQFGKELPLLLEAVSKLPDMDLKQRKLEDAEAAWAAKRDRTVFVP
ncbi:hypothetical protein LTR84_011165 [Exophiala bonariae]|uniref:Enoyl reductase (ER) domain-containing protein n=1 Tax=Exophiala bonariae TaxID=1690606 RepID=A0AAV9NM69_9EURO|nr:hypothetical protein LTR84_011165 [Exophiala bonariae]